MEEYLDSSHSNTPMDTNFFSLSEKKTVGTWKSLHSHSFGHVNHVTWKLWVGLSLEWMMIAGGSQLLSMMNKDTYPEKQAYQS